MRLAPNQERFLIGEFCASSEFKSFKDSLELLNNSIEGSEISELLKSMLEIDKVNKKMIAKINSMLEYSIEKYLTEAQVSEVEMLSQPEGEGIVIMYKHYIPSYISEEGIYTSIDTRLLTVSSKDKLIRVHDVSSHFDKAIECDAKAIEKKRSVIEGYNEKIEDMERNRKNTIYVVNQVNKYNRDAIKNNAIEKFKCMVSKNTYSEYLSAYDDILDELKSDYELRKDEFEKNNIYDYESKKVYVVDLQKGLLRRLIDTGFKFEYENKKDEVEMISKPISISSIYNI